MKTFPLNLIRHFFLLFLLTVIVYRGETQPPYTSGAQGQASVRYGGLQNEHLVFYVQVENGGKERLKFKIRDENNNVLFEELLSKEKFEQKFLFPKSDLRDIRFEIIGRNYNYSRQFGISTRMVEEVMVEEMK